MYLHASVQYTITVKDLEIVSFCFYGLDAAKRDGIRIMTVGVSRSVDEMELRGISSTPQERNKNYFMVPYFGQLSTIVERLTAEVCSENAPFVERSETFYPYY